MFAIRLLPPTRLGQDGERLGQIVVGDFRETFVCDSAIDTELENEWRKQLLKHLDGESAIILHHDPRSAWVVYKEGSDCFVQQRLSTDGSFDNLLPRVTISDGNEAVSEWVTDVAAIRKFLDQELFPASGPVEDYRD